MANTPPMPTAKELASDPSKIQALRVVDLQLILDAYEVEYPKKANKLALVKIVSDVVARIAEADKPVERDETTTEATTPADTIWTPEVVQAYEEAVAINDATKGDSPAEPPQPRHGQDKCRYCPFPAKVRSTGPRVKVGPNRHRQIRQMRCTNPIPHIYAKVTYYDDAGNVIR